MMGAGNFSYAGADESGRVLCWNVKGKLYVRCRGRGARCIHVLLPLKHINNGLHALLLTAGRGLLPLSRLSYQSARQSAVV
jgi:hypothetical protein